MEVMVNLVSKLLTDLEESIDREKLKLLLQYSKKLSKFEQKTLMIRNAIVDVLDQGSQDLCLPAFFLYIWYLHL